VVPWDHVGYGTNGYALRQQLSLASMELVGVHVFVIDRVLYLARFVSVFVFCLRVALKLRRPNNMRKKKAERNREMAKHLTCSGFKTSMHARQRGRLSLASPG
jgi:hypothetical protein